MKIARKMAGMHASVCVCASVCEPLKCALPEYVAEGQDMSRNAAWMRLLVSCSVLFVIYACLNRLLALCVCRYSCRCEYVCVPFEMTWTEIKCFASFTLKLKWKTWRVGTV